MFRRTIINHFEFMTISLNNIHFNKIAWDRTR